MADQGLATPIAHRLMSRLPNTVFIGAPKAGSTWFHRVLEAHPDCFTLSSKGANFFDRYWDRGVAWYQAFFEKATNELVIADISHDYLYDAAAPERIAEILPNAQLTVFVREPVARLESAVQFAHRSGKRISELSAVRETVLFEHSMYGQALTAWQPFLVQGTLQVHFYDDLAASPCDFWTAIAQSLGIDSRKAAAVAKTRHLPASAARSPTLARHLRQGGDRLRQLGAGTLVDTVKRSRYFERLFYRPPHEHEYFRFSEAERVALRETLRPDIYAFDELLGGAAAARWPEYWT